MKKRDAVIRGEPIKVKRPGRPKMTETEKESAREKRKEDYKNAVPYDNETMKESRPDTTSAAKPVTENPQKRKYLKKSQTKDEKPTYQIVVNDAGTTIGKKDQYGNFVPYKRRGRLPKNLGTKQTGFASPPSPHICGAAGTSLLKDKTDVELEDMLADEVQKKENTVAGGPTTEENGTQSQKNSNK